MRVAFGSSGSTRAWAFVVSCLTLLVAVAPARVAAQACVGDCGQDGLVTVDELVTMVNVAVGSKEVAECTAGDTNQDGDITIDEIIAAVGFLQSSIPVEVAGTCDVPGSAQQPLRPCPDGTPVHLYRCVDGNRDHCLSDEQARREIHFESGQLSVAGGQFQIPSFSDCSPNATYVVEAVFAQEQKKYHQMVFGPAGARRGRAAGAGGGAAQMVAIDPNSEAAVRLVDSQGLENFAAETFNDVLTAVTQANPPESFAGASIGGAADHATETALDDEQVRIVLGRVLRHDQPLEDTSIDPAGDQDFYKFSLTETTTVLLQMTRSSGDIVPCLEVVDQQSICGTDSARLELTLPPGTYQVFASAQDPGEVGSYRLYYLRLRPEDAVELPIVDSQTLDVGDLDLFTFGISGTRFVRLTATQQQGGEAQPCIELWRFNGAGSEQVTTVCDGNAVEQIQLNLDAGRYLVLVRAQVAVTVGVYTLQLFVGPVGGNPIVEIYDLTADWSDTNNPNGVWAYRSGTNALPRVTDWRLDPFPTPQGGWGPSGNFGNGLPFWFKSSSTVTGRDWLPGDVVVHTYEPVNGGGNGPANLTWTSPRDGSIDVSGAIWMGRHIGRANHWALSVRGTTLATGAISSADPYTRANPQTLAQGNGSESLQYIPISTGDVLRLQIEQTAPCANAYCADYIGVKLTVVLRSESPVTPTPPPAATATPAATRQPTSTAPSATTRPTATPISTSTAVHTAVPTGTAVPTPAQKSPTPVASPTSVRSTTPTTTATRAVECNLTGTWRFVDGSEGQVITIHLVNGADGRVTRDPADGDPAFVAWVRGNILEVDYCHCEQDDNGCEKAALVIAPDCSSFAGEWCSTEYDRCGGTVVVDHGCGINSATRVGG